MEIAPPSLGRKMKAPGLREVREMREVREVILSCVSPNKPKFRLREVPVPMRGSSFVWQLYG